MNSKASIKPLLSVSNMGKSLRSGLPSEDPATFPLLVGPLRGAMPPGVESTVASLSMSRAKESPASLKRRHMESNCGVRHKLNRWSSRSLKLILSFSVDPRIPMLNDKNNFNLGEGRRERGCQRNDGHVPCWTTVLITQQFNNLKLFLI